MPSEFKSDTDVDHVAVDDQKGNDDDRRDMLRMGKSQELRRDFGFASIFGFAMILELTWEAVLSVAVLGLVNGGTAGLIWIYFVCWMGFLLVNTSLAEMGSMAPTTGGQYHWVSEFAPRKYQKFLSYVMGWSCVLAWQTLAASVAYISGTQIQGLVVLNYPGYAYEAWHGTLLTIAIATFSAVFNVTLAKRLPMIEAVIVIVHVFAFFGIIVPLWVLAPRASAVDVFTTFSDGGGWGSTGVSALVGITAGAMPLLGADSVVHMSEEIHDAGRNVPRVMIMSTVVNGALGLIMAITFAFCLGDLQDIIDSPTGYPFLQVFFNATQTTSGATAMGSFVISMTVLSNLTAVAAASRQLWAFSRDQGLPFSSWFAYVHPTRELPLNSIFTTIVTTSLLSLINIGSATALNSITSLTTAALLASYICTIGLMIWRRATGQPLLPSKFSLGRWGLPINVAAEAFLVVTFVFTFFPTSPGPDAAEMNWNILIYGVVVVGSLLYYMRARHHYVGPVEYVRKLE